MKRLVAAFGMILAILAVSPDCWAIDANFINGGNFNSATNWDDGFLPTNDGDFHFIQNGLTSTFNSVGVSVTRLIVSDNTPGTLIMTGGDLTVAGLGNDTFSIGRSVGGNGIVEVRGASLKTGSADSSFVGERALGVLHIDGAGSVMGTDVWRVGHRGPLACLGCGGDGFLDVEGSFSAKLMFLGVDDGDGRLRVRGNGSVTLTDNLQPGVNTFFTGRSTLIEMVGSNASLNALNLESFNGATQVHNQYKFIADSGGVSEIKLANAVNIGNNDLTVDLTSFVLAPGMSLTLFDALPNQIYGDGPKFFDVVTVLGVANLANYAVVYDQGLGDILLRNIVPEPTTTLLLGLGVVMTICAKRRASR